MNRRASPSTVDTGQEVWQLERCPWQRLADALDAEPTIKPRVSPGGIFGVDYLDIYYREGFVYKR